MFIKRKKNRSGTTSIVVAEKIKGAYRELITIGIAKKDEEIEPLVVKGQQWIDREKARRHPRLDLFDEDARWDGLKGYLTNTDIPPEEVYAA